MRTMHTFTNIKIYVYNDKMQLNLSDEYTSDMVMYIFEISSRISRT